MIYVTLAILAAAALWGLMWWRYRWMRDDLTDGR